MNAHFKHIAQSPLVRDSAKLLSANVIAQVIGLVIYPLLTRLYLPDDFGELNIFLSMGGIITLLSTAELQYAIVLPKDDHKAWNLLQCALTVLIITTLATLWKPLLALYVFVMGLWTLLNYWYTRQQRFSAIARYQVGQSISSAALKSGMGYIHLGSGLIWGSILAPLLSLVSNWFYAGKQSLSGHLKTPWKKDELTTALQEYKNFPCYNLPRSLVNNLGGNLPALILAPVFSLAELGFFGMALTLAFRPINMVSASIYQVLFQQFSEHFNRRESIRPIFRKYVTNAALIAIPCFAILWWFLPTLCGWILGEGWETCGTYIRWMLPWLLCSLLVAPICSLSDVFGQQKKGFLFELLLFVARIGGMSIGLFTHQFIHAVIGYSIGNAVVMALQLIWYTSLVHRYELAQKGDSLS